MNRSGAHAKACGTGRTAKRRLAVRVPLVERQSPAKREARARTGPLNALTRDANA